MTNIAENIKELLKKAGYSKRYEGYKQLGYCIQLLAEDETRLCSLMSVYEEAAAKYGCTSSTIEKNIRKATESAWTRGCKEFIRNIEQYCFQTVPGTGQLLEIYLDYLKCNVG